MSRILAPAIEYAENGFPVSEIISRHSGSALKSVCAPRRTRRAISDGRSTRHVRATFSGCPSWRGPSGLIAEGGRDAFYKGEIAKKIVQFSDKHDGLLTLADFAEFDAQWVEPVSTSYRGYDVYELGAQTQGITVLEMLNILEAYDLKALGHNSAEHLHLMIEAKKLAFADRDAYIADPDKASVPSRPAHLKGIRGVNGASCCLETHAMAASATRTSGEWRHCLPDRCGQRP